MDRLAKFNRFLAFAKLFGFYLLLSTIFFSKSLSAIGFGVYTGALVLQRVLDKDYKPVEYPNLKFLLPLLASLIVSTAISRYLGVSLQGFGKYLEGFVLVYAGVDLFRDRDRMHQVMKLLLAVFFMSALAGVYQQCVGVDPVYGRQPIPLQMDDPRTRLTGTFKHYNDYGTFLAPGCLFALAFVTAAGRKRSKLLAAVLFAVLVYALFRTMSRSAIISFFVGLLVFSSFFRYRWLAFAASAAAIALVFWVPSTVSDRFHEALSTQVGSTKERLLLAKISIHMIQKSPIWGLGLNTYSEYFPSFRPPGYPALMYAHNSYLQIGAESGLVGLGLYVLYVVSLLGRFVSRIVLSEASAFRVLAAGLVSGAVAMLVNAFFESLLQSTPLRGIFWVLMGLAAAVCLNFLKPAARG